MFLSAVMVVVRINISHEDLMSLNFDINVPFALLINSLTFFAFSITILHMQTIDMGIKINHDVETSKYKKIIDTMQESILIVNNGEVNPTNKIA